MARRVGSWELDPVPIGSGSFAIVWKARHVDTGVQAAVKEISTDRLSPKLLESLESEIAVLRRTQHRNIVTMLDLIQEPGKMFLVLEYCSGGDLGQYLRRYRSISEPTARYFMHQLCEGLRELYSLNVLHRDLKPQNLLLSDTSMTPLLKIADFGFARSLQPQGMAETLCGSPLYMAPEILQSHKYDAKADLWSVGTILHELLTGRPPFTGTNHIQLLHNIQRLEPRLAEALPPHLSLPCRQLLLRLLRHRPQDRMGFEEFFSHPFVQGSEQGSGAARQQRQQGQSGQGAEQHGSGQGDGQYASALGRQSPAQGLGQQAEAEQRQHDPLQRLQQQGQQQQQPQHFATAAAQHGDAHTSAQLQHRGSDHQRQQQQQQQPAVAPRHQQQQQHPLQHLQQQQQQEADSDCEYVVVSGSNSPAPNAVEQAAAFGWTQSAHTTTLAGLAAAAGPSASAHTSAGIHHHGHHHHHHHHQPHHPHAHHHAAHHHAAHHQRHQHPQDAWRLHAQGGVGAATPRKATPIMASMASAWAAAAAQAVASVARSVQHVSPGGASRQSAAATAAAAQRGTFHYVPQQAPIAVPSASPAAGIQAPNAAASASAAPAVTPGPTTPVVVAAQPQLQTLPQPLTSSIPIPVSALQTQGRAAAPRTTHTPAASPTAAGTGRELPLGSPPGAAAGAKGVDAALLLRCAKLPERLDGPDLLQRVVLLLMESAAARVAAAEAAEAAAEEQEEQEEEEKASAFAATGAGTSTGGPGVVGKNDAPGSQAAGKEQAEAEAERRASKRRHAAQVAAGALPGQLLALHLYACQLMEAGLSFALGPQAQGLSSALASQAQGLSSALGPQAQGLSSALGPQAQGLSSALGPQAQGLSSQAQAPLQAAGVNPDGTGSRSGASDSGTSKAGGPQTHDSIPDSAVIPRGLQAHGSSEAAPVAPAPAPGPSALPAAPVAPAPAPGPSALPAAPADPLGATSVAVPAEAGGEGMAALLPGRSVAMPPLPSPSPSQLATVGSLVRASGMGSWPDARLVLPLKRQAASLLSGLKGRALRLLRGQVAWQQQALGSAQAAGQQASGKQPADQTQQLFARTAAKQIDSPAGGGACMPIEAVDDEEAEKAVAGAVPGAAEVVLDAAVRYSRAAAADELLGIYPASVEGYARAADLLLFLLADLPAPPGWHSPAQVRAAPGGPEAAAREGEGEASAQGVCEGQGRGHFGGSAEAAGQAGSTVGATSAAAAAGTASVSTLLLPLHLKPQLSAEQRQRVHTVYAAVKLRQAACMQALNAQLTSG